MRIAFNLWTLKEKQRREGIGWFVTHTLHIFIKKYTAVEFILFVTRDADIHEFAAPNVKVYRIFPNKRHPILYISFLHYVLPFYLRKTKPDLLVNPDGMSSLFAKTPQLPIIHDIHFLHLPKDAKWYNRWYYNRYFPKYAKLASRVATVSEFSRKDIAKHYGIPESKIDVTYCGVNDYFIHPMPTPKPFRFQQIIDSNPYFFFIGSINPRKNIVRLIEAFTIFRQNGQAAKLVIAGARGWLNEAVDTAYQNSPFKEDIIFTGRLADNEVKPLMENALALSFVPYYEGFGIPLVEAMICGTPVITSNVTSLPEVAGDAALIVDPFDTKAIATALEEIFSDEKMRTELVEKGYARASLFTWERTATLLWSSIEKAFENKK
jgi:glycosyltransferase involved in cell wall biosynthesis